jgi:hypothetical protein
VRRSIPASTLCEGWTAWNLRLGEAEDDTRFAIDILANADFVVSSHGSFAGTVARLLGDRSPAHLFSLFAIGENPAMLDRIPRLA